MGYQLKVQLKLSDELFYTSAILCFRERERERDRERERNREGERERERVLKAQVFCQRL